MSCAAILFGEQMERRVDPFFDGQEFQPIVSKNYPSRFWLQHGHVDQNRPQFFLKSKFLRKPKV